MLSRLRSAIEEYRMLEGVHGVIAALSGGADSCALLHSLCVLQKEYGFGLCAVHIDHGIRGDEAKRDRRFCEDFCRKLGVPLTVREYDVPREAAAAGTGLEETGRKIRYAAFEEERALRGFDRIATAHHADDNLETLVFNLTRGCALNGLCGIPPVRGNIIRPLIACSRADILEYCRTNGIEYVTDSTNADETYTRNYIRANVIPALRKLDADVAVNAAETCRLLRMDRALLDASALDGVNSRALLSSLPDALLSRHIIRSAPEGCPPERTHIEAAMKIIRAGGEKTVSFPNGWTFVCDGDSVSFAKGKITGKNTPPSYNVHLEDGIIELGGGVAAGLFRNFPYPAAEDPLMNIYNLSIYQSIDFDKIKGSVRVRPRAENDTYLLGGIHRSVKKLMQSRGIRGSARAALPFFCDDDGIVWIPGFPPRDGMSGGSGGLAFFTKKESVQ